ncbi:unnamed protein product [Gulo gulo]|uniref:Uncharacterized protein n=1 Tax=Gulo gulo TaxID=48420 RepID=A0A9X9Q8I5_GULGU|nr:unnamed protein product [Gulo gulo]
MTMPRATIMASGPVKAVRPSSREVFKDIMTTCVQLPTSARLIRTGGRAVRPVGSASAMK